MKFKSKLTIGLILVAQYASITTSDEVNNTYNELLRASTYSNPLLNMEEYLKGWVLLELKLAILGKSRMSSYQKMRESLKEQYKEYGVDAKHRKKWLSAIAEVEPQYQTAFQKLFPNDDEQKYESSWYKDWY